jgi:hypothetical protein
MRRTVYPAGLLALALAFSLAACDAADPASQLGPDAAAQAASGIATLHVDAATGHATRGRQERVDVCHYDADADAYKLITVAAPALAAHLRQGGGVPGGAVPNQEGYVFDDTCQPVPMGPYTCETVYGVDGLGRPTLTVTALAHDPAFLPISTSISGISGSGAMFGSQGFILDGGVRVGAHITFIATNPGTEAIGVLWLYGPGGGLPVVTCGWYPIIAAPAV